MTRLDLELTIHGQTPVGLSRNMIKKIIQVFAKNFKLKRLALGLRFVTSREITGINMSYRKKAGPTDVLSFGYVIEAGNFEGDIMICPAFAKISAKEQGIDQAEELRRLLIHGLLHLAGLDHMKKSQADKMFRLQELILKKV